MMEKSESYWQSTGHKAFEIFWNKNETVGIHQVWDKCGTRYYIETLKTSQIHGFRIEFKYER